VVELWQLGLLPIPLGGAEGKTPLVRGFTKMRRPVLATIETWARRWPGAGIGIVTGGASGVLVIDIDSADHAVWKTVEQHFGDTPLKIGTPGGGAHLYYGHSAKKCRNLRPELPVDVKATGGFVVVPPSVRPSGAHAGKAYTFLEESSWDDLARLPPIKPGSLSERTRTAEIILSSERAPGGQVVQLGAVDIGYRNSTLFRHALRQAPSCGSEQELLEVGIEINANFNPLLERSEVAKTISSAWGYEVRGENWVGLRQANASAFKHPDLAAYPDSALLCRILKRANGARDARGEPFAASPKRMANAQVIPGWGPQRYRRALTVLVEFGFLIIVHRGGRYVGDARKFAFRKGGPVMTPKLVVSNIADDDLMRVVDALTTGLSIRKAGEALAMDKSKVLRLKRRAEASGLFGPTVSAQQAAVSHCLEKVSHFAGPNVRTPPRLPPVPSVPKIIDRGEAFAAEEETGCLLNFFDGRGGYRPCGRPVGADGVFCEAHGGTQKFAPRRDTVARAKCNSDPGFQHCEEDGDGHGAVRAPSSA